MFEKIKNLIKLPYYYVPECPNCGSIMTGRYMEKQRDENANNWIMREGAKNGEIIALMKDIPKETNCFCVNCGAEFYYEIKTQLYTLDEIREERIRRKTHIIIDAIEKKEKEEAQKRGILSKHRR